MDDVRDYLRAHRAALVAELSDWIRLGRSPARPTTPPI